jgi:hypothetical protein
MPALAVPNTTTIRDVEIVQTGIEYPLATGPKTFTTEDLSDLVESQDDPAIKAPRLKLGHEANMGLLEDGQPAVGTVANLRLEQDGHLVMGDYVGVPSWLADVLPSAYPARSIEAAIGVETNTGHHWRLVMTDLALLGVVWPGVGTLDDIQALYSSEGPESVRVLTTKEEVEDTMARAARGVKAQVDTEVVRRSYYEQAGPDQFWWWIRSMFMDPNELIVEDEESGDLFRVPFETKGEKVEFGEATAVKVVYKDKPAKDQPEKTTASFVAPPAPKGRPLVVYANRAESRPDKEDHMAVQSDVDPVALRTTLGLAEDASDDEVRTALASAGFITPPGQEAEGEGNRAVAAEQPGTSAPAGPRSDPAKPDNTAPSGPTDPAEADPERAPGVAPEAGTVEPVLASDGTVRLDRETYQRLLSGAQRGDIARTHQEMEERERVISAAIQAGKVPPSRKAHWETMWGQDQDGTRHILTASADKGGLAPGLVPVDQAVGNSSPLEDTTIEAYPAEWLPEIQRGG